MREDRVQSAGKVTIQNLNTEVSLIWGCRRRSDWGEENQRSSQGNKKYHPFSGFRTLSKLPAQKQSQRSGNGSPWRKKDMNQPSSSTRWFRGLWDGHSETDDNSEAHAPSQKTNSKSADPESSVHVIWKESLYCTTSPLVPNTRLYTWLARGNSQEQTENEQTDVPHCDEETESREG
ncbi:uncharacterized protein LOC113593790 isoform X4 [Acinonyx jubatus]|uniref:Uncharacterized protein LOC113593790 isoform X4 n=1 Tax=Acinonyx jubatus TaxID=32536 RepID=A0ABM3NJY9_ACIJB|nr:uncharacterized protein LOC113593790 isoform X4 [Acinonyx jubatus]